ncbi:hypothetical protein Z517_04322 [Fonsecaea pedrosoi CBS 271.37]|uniref:Cytochrome P450 n=1 Tax=Fonsecaea pedrosoi CBS 271.37 TaxID=1442368 RepID=A0A0D2F3N6_9EURO|nr:uncharacterized protein Z517_04322 [Fonsecaea pedrosoi CBS 271.37]KIW81297.1 hypothetical protein Z517_04322 [Fonsecaea pedrosoi CBS 271.37]
MAPSTFFLSEVAFTLKYGPIVRIGPNQLSYNSGAAWKEIYFGTGTHEYLKDLHRGFGIPQDPNPKEWPMTVSDTPRHRRIRQALLPAFSERARRDQSPLLNSYLDILSLKLRERAGKAPEDIITWVNRFTVDALGHFCFGQSFNALQDSKTPALVNVLKDSAAYIPVSQFAQQYRLQKLLAVFTPAGAVNTMEAFNQHEDVLTSTAVGPCTASLGIQHESGSIDLTAVEKRRQRDRRAQQKLRERRDLHVKELEEQVAQCKEHHHGGGQSSIVAQKEEIKALKHENTTLRARCENPSAFARTVRQNLSQVTGGSLPEGGDSSVDGMNATLEDLGHDADPLARVTSVPSSTTAPTMVHELTGPAFAS